MEELSLNEQKAKLIADDCRPCSDEFYEGMYSGILITLEAQDLKVKEFKEKAMNRMEEQFEVSFFKRFRIAFSYLFKTGYKIKIFE